MHNFRRKFIFDLFRFSDIFIVCLSLFISYPTISHRINSLSVEGLLNIQVKIIHILYWLALILGWHILLTNIGLYRSRRINSKITEIQDIIKATTIGTLLLALSGIVFSIDVLDVRFIVVFWLSSTIITISFRMFLRFMLKKIRAFGRNLRFVLIVGTNQRAYDFANMIDEKEESGYRVIGFIDEGIYKPNKTIKIMGTLDDFQAIAKTHVIDEVVISLPIKSYYDEINKIVHKAEEHGIVVRYLSQLFNTKVAQSRPETFEGYTVMTMTSGPQDGWKLLVKRMADLIIASLSLILLSPLMIVVAVLIKLTSKGPVLFFQDRVGFNKRVFKVYKYRTMVVNAEELQAKLEALNEMSGPTFKIRQDPRMTAIGKWLRKFSIDELPQLFNVIRGDMSLVGPRPLPIRDFKKFSEDWLHRRCSVMPGMTCTWQINGRNNLNFEEWIKLDMEYIDNWKLFNDFKILIKTIPAVIRGVGAA